LPKCKAALALAALLLVAGCGEGGFFGESEGPPLPGTRIPILETNRSVSPHEAMEGVPVVLPREERRLDWPQAGGISTHSGGHLALSPTPSRIWQSSTAVGRRDEARQLLSPPIVVDGRVFVLDAVLNARAYDAQTGREEWAVGTAPEGEHNGFGGGLASDGERLYVAAGHGQALALEPESGRLFWRKDLLSPARAAPTVRGGQLIVLTLDNRLMALNTADGEWTWNVPGGGEGPGFLGGAAPAVNDDAVVAALSTGEIVAVRTANGRELWRNSLGALRRFDFGAKLSDVPGQSVLLENTVYAVSAAGRAAAFSMRTGNRVWERRIGSTQTPWIAGEWEFVVTDEAELVCIEHRRGLVRWVQSLPRYEDPEDQTGEYFYAGPILAGGNLIMARSDGVLVLNSPKDGSPLGEIDIGESTILPPIVADGTLYTLSEDGTLSAFR
jgi:outer membrane protein assembly factor BamB